ncbi:methyltransferase domain-containing protein [Scytonema sp. UIC 10036]|uniref:class I SAM-dependent methyltransferase n=1 Tax=Scytonema sp. UIC 10036 TaxID=2304196 RepID=UPI0012DABE6D|nr:class I SAM-dependent methyltransferase [Scytonema sp. UIC 10036]MUG98096.1 methyltransferase domain-containing protein [Scytonema sp. UIC 10036]
MDIFFEIYKDLPRQGPGNNESTRKVFSLLTDLSPKPSILDVGCGTGMQTIELAKLMDGNITAVDNYQPYLEELKSQVLAEGLSEKVEIVNASMLSLEFEAKSFDVIWSEGAIYIIGFEKGLQTWQPLLKAKGYLVVSELSWLKSNPPKEVQKYWKDNYPNIQTIESNLRIVEDLGYRKVGHFVLPESGWWDSYYTPLEERIGFLREQYKDNEAMNKELDISLLEIEFYRKYSDWYGYVFYLMQVT